MGEFNFLDLVILKKIDAESSVERFGSIINTSFFETANLLGTVKIKGYISIESSVGGISRVALTSDGQSLLSFAEHKANDPIEAIDNAILQALANGARDLSGMQSRLNVRENDLAFHINKLVVQGYMDYNIRSAAITFVLTEKGFNYIGTNKQGNLASQKNLPSKSLESFPENLPGKNVKVQEKKPELSKAGLSVKEDLSNILNEAYDSAFATKPGPSCVIPSQKSTFLSSTFHKAKARHSPKKSEKMVRFLSKMEYYILEYLPYILLLVIVVSLFIAAVLLSISGIV